MTPTLISGSQIEEMTGYVSPCKQLQALHQLGFTRAYRNRLGAVILEQPHYDAVTRGQFGAAPGIKPSVNVSFLRKAA